MTTLYCLPIELEQRRLGQHLELWLIPWQLETEEARAEELGSFVLSNSVTKE